jgi:hypothetical protein
MRWWVLLSIDAVGTNWNRREKTPFKDPIVHIEFRCLHAPMNESEAGATDTSGVSIVYSKDYARDKVPGTSCTRFQQYDAMTSYDGLLVFSISKSSSKTASQLERQAAMVHQLQKPTS